MVLLEFSNPKTYHFGFQVYKKGQFRYGNSVCVRVWVGVIVCVGFVLSVVRQWSDTIRTLNVCTFVRCPLNRIDDPQLQPQVQPHHIQSPHNQQQHHHIQQNVGGNGSIIKNTIPAIEITKDGGGESEPIALYGDDDEPAEYMVEHIDPRRRHPHHHHHQKVTVIGNGGSGGGGGAISNHQQVRLSVCVSAFGV